MNKKIKYDPMILQKGFTFAIPKNHHTQLHRMNNKMNTALSQAAAIHDALDRMLDKRTKEHIKWQYDHIKWQMGYSIFLTVVGIILFSLNVLDWVYLPNTLNNLHSSIPSIAVSFIFLPAACIMYRRRKQELRELFIDAI